MIKSVAALKLFASSMQDEDILRSLYVLSFNDIPNKDFSIKEAITRRADAKEKLNLVERQLIAKEVCTVLKNASALFDSELANITNNDNNFIQPKNPEFIKSAKFGLLANVNGKYHLVNPLTNRVASEFIIEAADERYAKLHELVGQYRKENKISYFDESDGMMILTGSPEVINDVEHKVKDIGYYCESVNEETGADGEVPEYSLKIFTNTSAAPEFDIEKAAAKHEQVGEDSKFSYWLQLEDNYNDDGYLDSKNVGDHLGFFYVTEKGTQAPALLVSQLGFSGDGLTAQRTYPTKSNEPGKTYLYEEYGYTDDDFSEVYNFLNDGLKNVSPEMNKKNLDGLTVDNIDTTNPNLKKDNPMLNTEGAMGEVVEKPSAEKPAVEKKAEEKIDFEKELMEAGESKGKKDKVNKEQLEMGKEVEKEHTTNPEIAEKITRDHLAEIPDYYTHLKEMEDNAKKNNEVKSSYAPFITIDATTTDEVKIVAGEKVVGTCKTIQAAFEKSANEFAYDGNEGARTTHKIYEDEKIIITAEDQSDEYFVTLYVGGLDQYPVHGKSINKERLMADADKVNFSETESEENPRLKEFGVTLEMLAKADEEATKVLKGGTDPEGKAEAPVEAATKTEVTKTAEDAEDNVWVVEKTSAPTIDDQLTLDIFYVVNKNTHVVAHDAGFEPFLFPTQEDAQKHADKLNSQKEASAKLEVKKEAVSDSIYTEYLSNRTMDELGYAVDAFKQVCDDFGIPIENLNFFRDAYPSYTDVYSYNPQLKNCILKDGPVYDMCVRHLQGHIPDDSDVYFEFTPGIELFNVFVNGNLDKELSNLLNDNDEVLDDYYELMKELNSRLLRNVHWEIGTKLFDDSGYYILAKKTTTINKKADEELKQFDMKQEKDGQKEFEKQDDSLKDVSIPEEKEDTSEVNEAMSAKPTQNKGESFSASEFGNNLAYIKQNNPEDFEIIMANLKQLMVGDQKPMYDFLELWSQNNFQNFTETTRIDPTYERHSQYQEQLKNNVLPKVMEMSEYKKAMEEKVSAEKGA